MRRAAAAILALALALPSASPAWSQTVVGGQAGEAAPGVTLVGPLQGPLFNFSVTAEPGQAVSLGSSMDLPAGIPAWTPAVSIGASASSGSPLTRASPSAATPTRRDVATIVTAAAPNGYGTPGALPALAGVEHALKKAESRDNGLTVSYAAGAQGFDGAFRMRDHSGPALEPAFEPPTAKTPEPLAPAGEEDDLSENEPRRPEISFQPAARGSLMSIEPGQALRGTMKLVKASKWSKEWWNAYRKGAAVNVVIRGEDVFGKPTTITSAVTKRIRDLTRDDFRGVVPKAQLNAGVAQLRRALIASLEETRARFSPNEAPVSLASTVRVLKFKSYLDLFQETHGKAAVPEPETPSARTPLKVEPEGKLKPLSLFLPRAVFLDMDIFDGPVSQELLSDIAKLQRTGVYFVAFSRKPYEAAASLKDKLIRRMSAYQLSVLMPIRFLAVTDDGSVISEIGKGGQPEPVDVLAFSHSAIEVLRDAAGKAAEQAGLSPRSVAEIRQPPLDDHRGEAFLERLGRSEKGDTPQSRYEAMTPHERAPDPRVRFEVEFPKNVTAEAFAKWQETFDLHLKAQGIPAKARAYVTADGHRRFSVQKTDLPGSLERLRAALGAKFGLYLNPGDALVLSHDPALMAANPEGLDVAALTGLRGAELVENALGLMLGEHRENRPGDLAGSASRMASFSRDRHRYLSEALVAQDLEEQNINFFSGHMVHATNDWLVWSLQNGRRPTADEYERDLRERWDAGLREYKPVGLPRGQRAENWLRESVTRGRNMYKLVARAHDRGETLVGTEVPNFFVLKDWARRSGDLKRRYILHTIFDFVALRPDPDRPGHATLVIYDFKTGPAKTLPKLKKDLQVLTYALFAHEKWVGERFPAPYLVGGKSYVIDDVSVEFVYSAKVQPVEVDVNSLDKIRAKIIGILNRIHAAEQKLFGGATEKKPAKTPAKKKPGN